MEIYIKNVDYKIKKIKSDLPSKPKEELSKKFINFLKNSSYI
jgi:hypothetical protein